MITTFSQFLEAAERRLQRDDQCPDLTQALLHELHDELRASAVCLWIDDRQQPVILSHVGDGSSLPSRHRNIPSGQVVSNAADSGSTFCAATELSGQHQLVLAVLTAQSVDGDLLMSLVEVLADLQRRRLLERQGVHEESRQTLDLVVSHLHETLDSDVISNCLATDAVAVTGAQRIMVAEHRGQHWQVVASTGVSQPDQRSEAVRAAVKTIEQAAQEPDQKISASGESLVLPLSVSALWADARWAAVFTFGQSIPQTEDTRSARLISHHAALAYANADSYENSSISRTLARTARSFLRPMSLFFWTVVLGFIALLCLVKTELRIEAYGELVPSDRVFVFAPENGTVDDVLVEDGKDVNAGTLLCELRNEDLEVQLEGFEGQLAAVEARLAAIGALKAQGRESGVEARQLSAEQLELQKQSESLRKQIVIQTDRVAQLKIAALFQGRVYGDQLRESLTGRPVQRGQYLFELAAPNNAWQLELEVPELDVRHVLDARAGSDAPLNISYALESSPEDTQQTRLTSLASSTTVNREGRLTTLAIAKLSGSEFSNQRPGTGVVAFIHCGRHRLGYVWFRKLFEFVQRNTWL